MSKHHNLLLLSILEGVAVFQFSNFMGRPVGRVSM